MILAQKAGYLQMLSPVAAFGISPNRLCTGNPHVERYCIKSRARLKVTSHHESVILLQEYLK